ncbi:putative CRAL-TRIO lipid binding domain-containing protein [Helianthus annuus]|nr:putative CRAL-TRIO lipid binding domain-containing protein [Helianthus annuus]KAJ0577867.1 putative CRAL-TRIO lipid binding domain-containing protein [Helianthus annuus]KAJ0747927.1 putative CRAL-TRIO lipid binding domain-containing protein [Helianthus annuus]
MQNTTNMDSQIRHMMDNVVPNLPFGQEEIIWLVDVTGLSFRINVPTKIFSRHWKYTTESLSSETSVAILYIPPRIFETFWKIVKLFLDRKTFQKVKFVYPRNKESVELMKSYFDVHNLPSEFGGKASMKMTMMLSQNYWFRTCENCNILGL